MPQTALPDLADHGGALTPPAQGTLAYTQPTRRACGSCHDDIDWARPYTANGLTMPAQADDAMGDPEKAAAPEGSHRPVIYPIAVVTASKVPALARAFVDLALSDEGQEVLRAHGFRSATKEAAR